MTDLAKKDMKIKKSVKEVVYIAGRDEDPWWEEDDLQVPAVLAQK